MSNCKDVYIGVIKPVLDWGTAFILLLMLCPFLILISLINLSVGMPVLFYHERPGLKAKSFKIIKFCTIQPESGTIGLIGNVLRKTSLDELPQLINVLRGEMSLIGPRPLLMAYMEVYTNDQKRRHDAKPGITGLAQVSGRNDLSLERKIEYDLEYVSNVSFSLDLKILIRTFSQIFKFIEADGHVKPAVEESINKLSSFEK